MVSDLHCPSMRPYAYPFLCLISLSVCYQKSACFAKEKKDCSSYDITQIGQANPWLNPISTDQTGNMCPLSNGQLHDQNADIDISDRDYFCVNYQYHRGNGGAVTARNLNITKNIGSVVFRENTSNSNGGALSSGNCNITYNKRECCFINNMANVLIDTDSGTQSGGAINCSQLVISNNSGSCEFSSNTSSLYGGAIYSTGDVNIINNYGSIILRNNKCARDLSRGGCIYSANCSITSNYAPITFIDNQAGWAGGIYVTGNCTISHNSEIIKFLNNSSLDHSYGSWGNPGGAAIYCNTCTITNNPKGVIFQNNASKRNGGVIYAQNLTIKDNGPILFLNNSSTWGSAIQNYGSNSRFYLFADYGDIVFKGNISLKNWLINRNALHSTPNLNLQIGARQGYSVKFYDTIENEHPSDSVLIFNPQNYHLGTVLFSGADISPNENIEKNYYSFLRNTNKIAYGVLAIEDKAGLGIYKISQEEGTLRLGNGAVIRTNVKAPNSGNNPPTPTTAGCTLTITKLALNLPSLLAKGSQAPKIWVYPTATTTNGNTTYAEDNNPNITLSGNLALLNSDNEDPYDSLDLSSGITRIPFLYLCDNTNKRITTTDLNIEAINDKQHYGHQGVWSPYWEEYTTTPSNASAETANTKHKYLYADWTPTGYIPNPEYRGDLVANALWQAAYNAITGLHTLETSPQDVNHRGISGGGLGAYVSQKTRNSQPGFDLFSRGYSAQASRSTETKHNFALSFAQFYSEIKESKSTNKVSSNCYFGGAQLQIPWFDESILTSASLGYAYAHSRVKTKNQTKNITSEGHFHGHTLGSELCCMLPEGNISHLQFRPFVKALGIHAIQESFTETGEQIRSFETKDPLINVTLPLGIYCHVEHEANLKTNWEIQLAYTPTIYRQKPKITTTRLISQGTWITSGTPVDHHAGSISVKNTTTLLNTLSLSINYRGDFSKSTLCNFLNITSEIQF